MKKKISAEMMWKHVLPCVRLATRLLTITEAIYVKFCVECGTEYFIFNGKEGHLEFGVTPF